MGAGSVVDVRAGIEHRFHSIEEDLTVLVVFASAGGGQGRHGRRPVGRGGTGGAVGRAAVGVGEGGGRLVGGWRVR